MIPEILKRIQEIILQAIPPDLLDKSNTWIEWPGIELYRAIWRGADSKPSKKLKLHLLRAAQDFLSPLAEEERCRTKRPKWRNVEFSPSSPYGNSWWMFHCLMVQEILWLHREFLEGFEHARTSPRPCRDDNPWSESARERSWDCGYILGLVKDSILEQWCDSHGVKNGNN